MAEYKVETTHPGDDRETVTPMVMNDKQMEAVLSDETNRIEEGGSTPDVVITIHASANPPYDD